MVKLLLKSLLAVLVCFVLFSFWMSPRLGGIIPLGKEEIDRKVTLLTFDTRKADQYHLTYLDLSSREDLKRLRREYNLDSLVKDAGSDFEKVTRIQSWVQSRWKHDGETVPEQSDALYILREAEKGRRFRCVEYSIVTTQCLSALGFKVRGLGLMTRDISEVKWGGGHAVNEVYLPDSKKWVFMDPQYDVMTMHQGVPLNAVELQRCIALHQDFQLLNPNHTISKEKYIQWIGPYLYYFYVSINGQSISVQDRIVGNKKQLTLYPLGATQPAYFQKIMRLNTSHYTHSLTDFYPVID